MSEAVDAHEFHDRMVSGTDHYKTIVLEGHDGSELEGVEMHVVSKRTLTEAIDAMPESVFEAVEDVDEDIDPEEAEEMAQDAGGAQVSAEMYDAFEKLCKESFAHPNLSDLQMDQLVEEYDFNTHFELGSEVLTFSIENSGSITGFRELN